MEHIQLQTPWKRGDGQKCKVPGLYFVRHVDGSHVCLTHKSAENWMLIMEEYAGPVSISAPEPMPELVQVEGCPLSKSEHENIGTYFMLAAGNQKYLGIRHPDERTARLAFNAAAKVMNGEGS